MNFSQIIYLTDLWWGFKFPFRHRASNLHELRKEKTDYDIGIIYRFKRNYTSKLNIEHISHLSPAVETYWAM